MTNESKLLFPVSVVLTARDWAKVAADLLVLQDIDYDTERAVWIDAIMAANTAAFYEQAVKEVTGL